MQLRELAPERDVPVTEHVVKIAERFRELVRRLVKNDRPVLVPQRFQMLLPGFVRCGEKAFKREPLRRETGHRERRDDRARAGRGGNRDAVLSAQAHQLLAGVGDRGHARVGDKRAALPAEQAGDNDGGAFHFVVLIIADERAADAEVVEELQCDARILRGDKVRIFERFDRAGGEIVQIADGRSHQIQCSGHKDYASQWQIFRYSSVSRPSAPRSRTVSRRTAHSGAPFTASIRKMGAHFPGTEKTSLRRTGVR